MSLHNNVICMDLFPREAMNLNAFSKFCKGKTYQMVFYSTVNAQGVEAPINPNPKP